MDKQFIIKIWDGAVLKFSGDDFVFSQFSSTLNGGLSSLNIVMPNKYDDYGEGTIIKLNNEVQIWAYTDYYNTGKLIYSGYISSYTANLSMTEGVEISVTGYLSRLQQDVLKSNTTIKITYSATEIGVIIKDVIDKYRTANAGTKINYGASTIGNTATNITTTFDSSTYLEAIELLKNTAGYNWYYYLDSDNLLYFSQYPATALHNFVIGNQIVELQNSKSLEQLVNGVIFWNGMQAEDPEYISKYYSDSASQTAYGRYIIRKKDSRFKSVTSADENNNRTINTFKNPINPANVRILGKNYNIEDIKAGQVCKIWNTNVDYGNLLITKATYNIDYIDLELVNINSYLDKSIYELKNQINDISYSDSGPTTYT